MASQRFATPFHGHVGRGAFGDVYEPAEDTFLLLDALEAAAAELAGCEEGRGSNGKGLRRSEEVQWRRAGTVAIIALSRRRRGPLADD